MSELLDRGMSYHKQCYKNLTNKEKIESCRMRFEKGSASGVASDILKKKVGRPSSNLFQSSASLSRRVTRDKLFYKDKCIFCQEVKDVDLHEVSTRNMGRQLIEIGQKTDNTVLKVRLVLRVTMIHWLQ